MSISKRRHDIDWLRVVAIGLLLIYHVAIGFQSWGIMIGFITNENPWESLWIPMSMLNVWRIPLLFFVSGMGVYFAIQNRDWKQLIRERAGRILLPFIFGVFLIVPVHVYIWQNYNHLELQYTPGTGHLWFLGNIFVYVLMLSPLFFYLKRNRDAKIGSWIKSFMSNPGGILLVILAFIAEGLLLDPNPYTMYAMTWHGFFLGMLAFLFGYLFVLSGPAFLNMILKWRWLFLCTAIILFTIRMVGFQQFTPAYFLAIESNCWIVTVLGFGYKYLNHPSKTLRYLSEAAYPIYIIHMIFLYLGSMLVFRLEIDAPLQFILVLGFTGIGCFALYELFIRRIPAIRPLFGLKRNKK